MHLHGHVVLPVVLCTLAATSLGGRAELELTPPVPTEASSCQAISPASMRAYARTIEQALKYAQKDFRANGQNGAYAVAAKYSRDLLDQSRKQMEEAATKLQGSDPGTTTYAEGGMIKEYLRSTIERLPQAGHWALVSAIYHTSTDAQDAFEGTVTALAEGQRLFAESGRCYLTGWL